MAVYSKLLLSAGGGIVSSMQQAEQARNTATILIGLGGTGIDCLRTIKTQVRSRLRPDNPNAVVPTYEHIRFLGVDTAEKSKGDQDENRDGPKAGSVMALDDTECFSIANAQVKKAFAGAGKALGMREELAWLCWEDIQAPNLSTAGAGGIRQVGRYMMMDKSKSFMNRLEKEINAAKAGLSAPTVNVHIFSGLSGGTGAGCFLDVCYMVRHIANRVGGITIFGYFFLPDVNLSRIPFSDNKTRTYIPKNGYAAMQELDYCMQLQYNGGSFTQTYQDHTEIVWHEPPVDMCHLVCATNANGDIIENAYDYSMNVTAEYIMDFLTHSTANFGLDQQLSNFVQKILQGDGEKVIGSHLAYCVIGAACACIPLREINTYLASELFSKFSQIGGNTPTKADVEKLAVSALARGAQGGSGIYDCLYRKLREKCDDSYAPYPGDWKDVRDYGDNDLIFSYTDQTSKKEGQATSNSKNMADPGNKESLINLVREQLAEVIRDINRGPIFAHGLISAAQSHNLLNIIDGLIQENNSRLDQEKAQDTLRSQDYRNARDDVRNRRKRSLLDNDQKRIADYEYYVMLLEQHKLAMHCYQELDNVLKTFRKQLVDVTAAYYIKLSRVMDSLIQSFKENRDALASEKTMQTKGFAIPMMTIKELKGSLDIEIEKINVPGMLDQFMSLFLNHEEAWITEDESKIVKLVNTFFVETAFNGFANRTITSFLKDKYGLDNDEQLADKIYTDWMQELTAKASPLFYFNDEVWKESQAAKLAFLSFPDSSNPIKAAAQQMHRVDEMWEMKESALTDRIFVMCSACALPLSAYNNCAEYEKVYFSSSNPGCHYYEGKSGPGMAFNDWRNLSSLTPQSLLHLDTAPEPMQKLITAAQDLYDQASPAGVFDDHNRICAPDPTQVEQIKSLVREAAQAAARASKPTDLSDLQEMLEKLKAVKDIPMVPTQDRMQDDGHAAKREDKLRVQKDHFVAAVPYHDRVRGILKQVDELKAAIDGAAKTVQDKIDKIGQGGRARQDFCNALFTGVICTNGPVLTYRKDGYSPERVLSQYDTSTFPFCDLPFYQAFLSYQSLLTDEERDTIRESVGKLYNTRSPQIQTNGTALKEEFSEGMVNSWFGFASQFPECSEIMEFLQYLREQFNLFCMRNRI